jgi:hypothetical protein
MAHKLPPAATLLAAFAVLLALAAAPLVVVAGDPDMLQDICVADYHSLKGRKSSIDLYFHYNVLMRDSQ